MHIFRVYKRNGYNVCDLGYLCNCLAVRHFLLTVSGFGVLRLIANTLVKLTDYWEGPFDLGIFNVKHGSKRLLKTGI